MTYGMDEGAVTHFCSLSNSLCVVPLRQHARLREGPQVMFAHRFAFGPNAASQQTLHHNSMVPLAMEKRSSSGRS